MKAKRRIQSAYLTAGVVVATAMLTVLVVAWAQPIRARSAQAATQMPAQVSFEHYLFDVGSGKWVIGNTTVLVDAQTQVVQEYGPAERGAWVKVWATQTEAGGLHADMIVVLRPKGQRSPPIQFTGRLAKMSADEWIVDGRLFKIAGAILPEPLPEKDWLLWVVAEQRSLDLYALFVRVIARSADEVPREFEGALASYKASEAGQWWNIGSHSVWITKTLLPAGEPPVGKEVEVRAVYDDAGTLTAEALRVVEGPSPMQVNALVAHISQQADGAQVWNVIAFGSNAESEPIASAVHVSRNTMVDESRATARAGQWGEVHGVPIGTGLYQADVIRLEQPVLITVSGNIRKLTSKSANGAWLWIDNRQVWVAAQKTPPAGLRMDEPVVIRGRLLGNGVIWADQVQVQKNAAP
ncbi:MAG: hypothetical protein FJ011_02810 [Chloroflexi bacterium]|nr:hypothetical protein [Chloroflexota bacterium]